MKKSIFVFAAIFSFAVLFTGCKETKKEEIKEEVNIENHDHTNEKIASNVYQCPMDCEKGKTYDAEGSCPVCKMDLKETDSDVQTVE
ncbi:MAG: heavy metal-binding domain-containing protein [Lutibacter sp.]